MYNAIEHKGCPRCKQFSNKEYDKTNRNKESKKIYNSGRWQEARMKAMVRDNFLCVHCKAEGKDTKGDEVDHIIELSDGGSAYDIDNLQYLCKFHHKTKTESEKQKRYNYLDKIV